MHQDLGASHPAESLILGQGYIAHTAARAIIFIEAAPPVGLICVMPIGMAEVSSCKITVSEGQSVTKGKDELGFFQYGGSSYCMVFRPGIINSFTVNAGDSIKMGQQIAAARK